MFSRKKIAALSGLIGGLAVTSMGITHAHAAGDPASCTRNPQGDVICVQHIEGETAGRDAIPHQETCMPVQSVTLPAPTGNGTTQLGPRVTCSPATSGAPRSIDGKQELPGLLP
ncbi:hypothetical protein [Streptomyces sp. NBC_00151]|uniref:hypothetical protein n=1 Tax=Streptomyces sp. NBC_00151 TaxID=2975669 RepID=UPI002DDAE22B|nr:hypothetical protein [Streptomyces sp. NBC_00151]WRZ41254.1 hypothetical protein OG915_26365 [Streptomyces sp. NBC_00151]